MLETSAIMLVGGNLVYTHIHSHESRTVLYGYPNYISEDSGHGSGTLIQIQLELLGNAGTSKFVLVAHTGVSFFSVLVSDIHLRQF